MESHQNGPGQHPAEPTQLPKQPPQPQPQNREETMSVGLPASSEGAPSTNGDAVRAVGTPVTQNDPYTDQVRMVINSEIGVQTLLNRLKQSISSAKEFALFLKKRSVLEEEHANGLRKICRMTHENLKRPDYRQGSFSQSYDDITRIHERMADNGSQFAGSLHQMHDDLLEMASRVERGRKHWKQTGLTAEQRLSDAEIAMRKSKAKYDAVAADYDRARMGDRQGGKMFGLKNKSGAQYEEDQLRKMQAAEADYASKVQFAQGVQGEIASGARPEASQNIQELIKECDSALTLQMQKFATFNEKLLLFNGMTISPLKNDSPEQGNQPRSLREVVAAIDNEKDFNYFIGSHAATIPAKAADIKFERHPALMPQQMMGGPPQRLSDPAQGPASRQGSFSPQGPYGGPPFQQPQGQQPNQGPPSAGQPMPHQQHERSFSQGPPQPMPYNSGPAGRNGPQSPQHYNSGSIGSSGPPQLSTLPFQPQQQGQNGPPQLSNLSFQGSQPGPNMPPQGHPSFQGSQQKSTGPPQLSTLPFQTPQQGQNGPPQLGSLPFQTSQQGQNGPPQLASLPFQGSQPGPTTQQQRSNAQFQGSQPGPGGPPQLSSPSSQTLQQKSGGPPQLATLPFQTSAPMQNSFQHQMPNQPTPPAAMSKSANLPPLKPVFGVSLDDLFERDGSAVPMVVHQCIQAVDLFGLEVEGIYRVSGTTSHLAKMKAMFDNDASKIDFRDPENFFRDVNSVAGLLKQFFRELPDPLLTREHYANFIEAAKHDDDIVRRDQLHAIINALPDPNYATLRAMTLHLHRVTNNAAKNRMIANNLAIVFGPTLMGAGVGHDIQDSGWQVRVIETVLNNCYQIFDDD